MPQKKLVKQRAALNAIVLTGVVIATWTNTNNGPLWPPILLTVIATSIAGFGLWNALKPRHEEENEASD